MKIEIAFGLLPAYFELPRQRRLVHANPHARHLESVSEHRIPQQQVAVQPVVTLFVRRTPVVVIRGAAVMRLAVRKGRADPDHEYGAVSPYDLVLALFRFFAGIQVEQLLRMDEMDLLGQRRNQLRELDVQFVFGHFDRLVDTAHRLFQESDVALFARDHLLPIPLVDVQRMDIVQLFVRTQRVHIGINPTAGSHFHFA